MRVNRTLLCIATIAVTCSGCIVESRDDDGSSGGGGTAGMGGSGGTAGAGGSGGDACYEPSVAEGSESGSWSEPNEENSIDITVPGDPGGGLVRIRLTADHPEAIPWLNVLSMNELNGGAILSGSAVDTANEQEWNGVFVAAPNESYRLLAHEFFNAPPEAHPVSYTIAWTFESTVDCYEPNDTLATASPIALGEVVEARLLGGYASSTFETVLDHYAVTVDAPTSLTFSALSSPSNGGLSMRMFRPDESQISGGGAIADGATMTFDATEAGTYVVEVRPDASLPMKADQDDADPANFSETYSFRID
jgi:hypothetical protein